VDHRTWQVKPWQTVDKTDARPLAFTINPDQAVSRELGGRRPRHPSAHPDIDYSFVEVEVFAWFDNTVPNTKDYYNFVKDKFEDEKQLGCPLN